MTSEADGNLKGMGSAFGRETAKTSAKPVSVLEITEFDTHEVLKGSLVTVIP